MKKIVLLYNFSEERLSKVKRAILPLKAVPKVVGPDEYGQKLGYLIGEEGYLQEENPQSEAFKDEMLVMSGFTGSDIDMLIFSLKKHGAGRVALKAVVTETNIGWTSSQLHSAIEAEHQAMKR